jgi:hypothetical protein
MLDLHGGVHAAGSITDTASRIDNAPKISLTPAGGMSRNATGIAIAVTQGEATSSARVVCRSYLASGSIVTVARCSTWPLKHKLVNIRLIGHLIGNA